ncbi:MAG TPA: hypothetical protein VG755_08135 [Nannocystaceae bacterium]|nr:hypothetical protein [Nannocystaceae bacterium]
MRLVRCPACDRHVLASATSCPFCRTRTVIATIAIGFTLAGCPSAVYGGPPPQPPSAPTPTPPEQEGAEPPRPDGTNAPPIESGPSQSPAPSTPASPQ